MLDGYTSDKEQLESIKKWWNDSGKGLVFAIVIGLALGVAWKYWHKLSIRRAENASVLYQSVLQADSQNQLSTAQGGATLLMAHFSSTPYASLAGLLFAKELVSQNKLSLALTKLEWVIKNGKEPRLKQIAQLLAARILLSENKTADAMAELKIINDKQFQPMIDWVKGDIYLKENNVAKANAHYESAKKALSDFPPAENLLTEQLAS